MVFKLAVPKSAQVFVLTTTGPSAVSSTSTVAQAPMNVTTQVSLITNKPRNYAGEKPKDFIDYYDVISEGNNWDPVKKLQHLPALFHDHQKGKDWYQITFGSRPPPDYQTFCDELKKGLAPSDIVYDSFAEMTERVQHLNESPTAYYMCKRNLIKQHDDTIDETMKVSIIVAGLRQDIKRKIFGKHRTCADLLEALKNEETLRKNDTSMPTFAVYPEQRPPPYRFTMRPRGYSNYQPQRPRYPMNQRPPMYHRAQTPYAPSYNASCTPPYNVPFNQQQNFGMRQQNMYPNLSQQPRYSQPRYNARNMSPNNPIQCYTCHLYGHTSRTCIRRMYQNHNQRQNPSAPAPKNT